MSRGLLLATFFILSIGVMISLLFAYKYVKEPTFSAGSAQQINNLPDLDSSRLKTDIEKSWLKDIDKRKVTKSYIYAYREIQLELN